MTAWSIDVKDKPMMRLVTRDFGGSEMSATAPITGGRLVQAGDVQLRIELSLGSLKTGNFVTQTALRALIKKYRGDQLVFEATSPETSTPWQVSGTALAGSLEIPMTVIATPAAEMTSLHLGGTVTMDDVRIPIPGLSGVSTVTFTLDGAVRLRAH